MSIGTDVSSATELMKEGISEAHAQFSDGASEAARVLEHSTQREKYEAFTEAAELKEQIESLRDNLAEIVSFAQDYLSEAESLVLECEERESTLETAWEDAEEE